MTFFAFRGNAFEHTHENHAFNELHDQLQNIWLSRDEPLYLFGNFFVGGKELDALIVKRNAIIVLDFKDYGGELKFSENGRWRADGVEVKGGNSINPYQQIRNNKFALLEYIQSGQVSLRTNPNLGHIAGLVLFHQDILFDTKVLPVNISRWFHIADFSHVIRGIDAIVSREIDLPESDLRALVEAFDVPPYWPDGNPEVVSVGKSEEISETAINYTHAQQSALETCSAWLSDDDSVALIIEGMVSTGKRTLLKPLLDKISTSGSTPQLIAPNSRIAQRYIQSGYECSSLYQLLYSNKPDDIIDDRSHHPVKLKYEEVSGQTLVLVEAHLLCDSFFATDNMIYGTGHIIHDLLDSLGDKPPKLLLLGDPYQLSRGSLELSFLNGKAFEDRELKCEHVSLREQIRPSDAHQDLLEFQAELASSMESTHFNRLPSPSEENVVELKTDDQRTEVSRALTDGYYQAVYLCGKNETAHLVNGATKIKVLQHTSANHLDVGDKVDFHNRTPAWLDTDDPLTLGETWVNAGDIASVEHIDGDFETRAIRLKGRDKDTVLNFGIAQVRVPVIGSVKIRYLQDYLAADKPELNQDQLLALQIWARQEAEKKLTSKKQYLAQLKEQDKDRYQSEKKQYELELNRLIMSDSYFNAARIRFAYAMTVHRAQGRQWQHVIINAESSSDTSSPDNASYFRWLYTATVCASDRVSLMKYPKLDPLSNAVWKHNAQCQIAPIQLKKQYYYDKNYQLNQDDKKIIPPPGFSNPANELVLLMLSIHKNLDGFSWRIDKVAQHDYQEHYWFINKEDKQVKARFSYNADYTITNVVLTVDNGDDRNRDELWSLLQEKPEFNAWEVAQAVNAIEQRLFNANMQITSTDEKPYRALLTIQYNEDVAVIEVNVGAKGMVSTIRPIKATSDLIFETLSQALMGV